ncbi:hypothetical protein SpCBS45565_g04354 [Spizellomyces sp. 'palustris']|nr:hypothetical protein SpCBS45565_g04354 [Spizellomyces sp. 'palustris']
MPTLDRLILDFDETITVKDTTPVIAATANRPLTCPAWSSVLGAYLEDYKNHTPPEPTHDPPTTEDLLAYLDSYKSVERASISRVTEAGALRGTTRASLFAAGASVPTQEGWSAFANCWLENRSKDAALYISSVNWSMDIIRGSLNASNICIPDSNILANDLEYDSHGISTGGLSVRVMTGCDKLRGLQERLGNLDGCIYIGDR